MKDDRIGPGASDPCEPTPEEIKRVAMEARRLRSQAFWKAVDAPAKWLAHASRGRALAPAVAAKEHAQSA